MSVANEEMTKSAKQEVDNFRQQIGALQSEVGRVIVGQKAVVEGVITCLLAGSHALLEGVPGLGKTMLVRTLADALGLSFSRIQLTPDLMPADIIGTTVIDEAAGGSKRFEFRKGPVFANILLADEVNRATPKTQSALLEAMQEHQVTVGRTTHTIEPPYFVLATQNPLEMEGTYPLPEAQLDRFFFKLEVPFPDREDLHAILERTTGTELVAAKQVLSREQILKMQAFVRTVPLAHHVQDYAVRLVLATHPKEPQPKQPSLKEQKSLDLCRRFVATGASPRGAQALVLAAKIRCLLAGRYAPAIEDVKAVALPALRHRVLLNFEGEAEGIKTDRVIEDILATIPETQ
jgi:MoxR-like ATPase